MRPKHQKTVRKIMGRANFEKTPFFLGLSWWVLCKTDIFDCFAYAVHILLSNHCNNKKYMAVGKIVSRAIILD